MEEREKKKIERQQKAEELEEKRKQRQEELKRKREERQREKERKELERGVSRGVLKKKVFVTRSVSKTQESEGYAPQNCESTSNECTICFGSYSDDLDSDGTPMRVWVECTNPDCKKWMHEDCTSRDENGLLMCPCGVTFK